MQFGGVVLAVMLCLSVTSIITFAGEVTGAKSMQFGVLTLHPDGDTIVIAATDGPASPEASRSHVEGGQSGLLTLTSELSERVQIDYPETVILSDEKHSLTIRKINDNSEYSDSLVSLPGGGEQIEVSIGGSLTLTGKESQGTYSGSMTIHLIYYNN